MHYKREMHAGSINAMIIGMSQNKERRMPVEIKMVELDGERVLLSVNGELFQWLSKGASWLVDPIASLDPKPASEIWNRGNQRFVQTG